VKAEFARAHMVLRKAVRHAQARVHVNFNQSRSRDPRLCPGKVTFEEIMKLQSIASSHDSGSKRAVMWLNPLTCELFKTRQENAEAYRQFAEKTILSSSGYSDR
jgi:hypothetical protein